MQFQPKMQTAPKFQTSSSIHELFNKKQQDKPLGELLKLESNRNEIKIETPKPQTIETIKNPPETLSLQQLEEVKNFFASTLNDKLSKYDDVILALKNKTDKSSVGELVNQPANSNGNGVAEHVGNGNCVTMPTDKRTKKKHTLTSLIGFGTK